MPQALLLDLDNTAYAYAPCHAAGLAAAQREAASLRPRWQDAAAFAGDYARSRHAVKSRLAGQAAGHCRRLYFKAMTEAESGRSDLGATERLHAAYWRAYHTEMRIEPGCCETLAALRARGMKLCWVSNFTTGQQVQKLGVLGLLDAANFLVTSEEALADKPDARIFALALEKLGVTAAQAWLLGDDPHDDIAGGKAAGLTTVWLRRGAGQAAADHAIDNWLELLDLL